MRSINHTFNLTSYACDGHVNNDIFKIFKTVPNIFETFIAVYKDSLVMISIERSETAHKNALDVGDKLK